MKTLAIKIISRFVVINLILLFILTTLNAQNSMKSLMPGQETEQLKTNIGFYGLGALSFYTPNFSPDPGISGLIFNNNKTLLNGGFGFIGNFPINDRFVISGRIGYESMSGHLNKDISNTSYNFSTSLNYLSIAPVLQIHNLLFNENFYLAGGFEFGVPFSKNYTLTNSTTNSNIVSNSSLPNTQLRYALLLGAGYNIPLSQSVFLIPEISYSIPFNNISSNTNFTSLNIPQLRAGLALTFGLGSSTKEIVKKQIPNNLDVSMKEIRGYDENNKSFPLKEIDLRETEYKELHPIIPYVFFTEDKSVPDDNEQIYETEPVSGKFNVENLPANSLSINKHSLDIIGSRMQEYSTAHLTITGTNDGKGELKSKDLSSKRADWAKNYLVKYRDIPSDRIDTKHRDLPEKPSTSDVADGVEENRRIEFASTQPDILSPIEKEDSSNISYPSIVEFVPDIKSKGTVNNWKLALTQSNRTLSILTGKNNPPVIKWQVQASDINKSGVPVDWVFNVTTQDGLTKNIDGSIPVAYKSSEIDNAKISKDKMMYKFNLVLFDFDKYDISDADMQIIKKKIIPVINYKSKVTIYGYCDRIGTEEHNQSLSENRANAVKDVLEQNVKCSYETHGLGETVKLFDNNIPLGRQLSRAVVVVVESPLTAISSLNR